LLLICLGWYALLAALRAEQARRRWWVAFAVTMTLAIYAHLFSALVLAAQLIAFATLLALPTEWRRLAQRSLRPMAISLGAIAVALIPVVLLALSQGSSNRQVPPATVRDLARLLWNIAGHNLVFGVLLALAVAIAVVTQQAPKEPLPRRFRHGQWDKILLLLCWLIVPVVLSFALTQPQLNLHLFAWGYMAVIVPALCLLAGIGVAALTRLAVRAGLALAIVGTAALSIVSSLTAPPLQDFRAASHWIALRQQSGDGLLCTSWSCAVTIEYYVHIHQVPAALLSGAPTPWSWTADGARPLDLHAVAAYVAAHPRVFLVDAPLGADWAAVKAQGQVTRDDVDRTAILVDRVEEASSLGPIGVRLYETRPAP
jgi:hypothetical protein